MIYTKENTALPEECLNDARINKVPVEIRQEKWMDELHARYLYYYEKKLREFSDSDFWRFAFHSDKFYESILTKEWERYKIIKSIKRLSEYRDKEEMIENLLEDVEWSESEYIEFIVDVYIND